MMHMIQNDPEVPPGNIIEHLAIPCAVHHPYRGDRLPEAAEISALIVLGGPMGANDDDKHPFLYDLKWLIRQIVAAGIPYLGICLGGQLLAAALGAKVASGRWEEIGHYSVTLTEEGSKDLLFRGIPQEFRTFQWHHDSFDLPDGAVLLAGSAACPHQAFRAGACAWGVQFHPEVTEDIIRDWCAWDSKTQKKTEELIFDFICNSIMYSAIARHLVDNFITIASQAPRCSQDIKLINI